jgi:stage V sporulation protein S
MESNQVQIFKSSSATNTHSLAAAVEGAVIDNPAKSLEIRAIGAQAVNQAIKAVIKAKGSLSSKGYNLTINPCFKTILDPVKNEAGEVVATAEKSAVTLQIIISEAHNAS